MKRTVVIATQPYIHNHLLSSLCVSPDPGLIFSPHYVSVPLRRDSARISGDCFVLVDMSVSANILPLRFVLLSSLSCLYIRTALPGAYRWICF